MKICTLPALTWETTIQANTEMSNETLWLGNTSNET